MRPQALAHIRVLDMTDQMGAYAGKIFRDLGADVIRLEQTSAESRGVDSRRAEAIEIFSNAGKRRISLALDLPQSDEAVRSLASSADLLLFSGQSAGVDRFRLRERLEGLDSLIVSTLTPFGLSGPKRDWKGNDLIAWAAGGLAAKMGDSDRPPVIPSAGLAEFVGAQYLAIGSLIAIRERTQSSLGQWVDVSLQECVASMSGECGVPLFLDDLVVRTRTGSHRPISAPFGHFPAKDGFVSILAITPSHWLSMRQWIYDEIRDEAVMNPDWEGGPEARTGSIGAQVNVLTTALTQRHEKRYLFEQGQRRGIPCTPVNEPTDILTDPHLKARQFWVEVIVEGETHSVPGAPFRLSHTAWRQGGERLHTPGEDGNEVWSSLKKSRG